jgi:hypothetical protein
MIIDMSIIENQLVQILTNCVENYDAICKEKAKKCGVTAEDIIVSIVFDDSAPVGLAHACNMKYLAEKAQLTIATCKFKDPALLPVLLQHKATGGVFAAGISRNSFCVFNISGDFSVICEADVCR